jgi:hypothetical protein
VKSAIITDMWLLQRSADIFSLLVFSQRADKAISIQRVFVERDAG